MNNLLPLYDVHPITIKLLKKGHPWILKDKFTEKFQPRERFIVARERRRPISLLLHDPKHTQVKARVWASKGDFGKLIKNFRKDLNIRIDKALKKRKQQELLKERENIFLVFGEADELPGIKITLLKDQLLFQFYSFFWENYEENIIQHTLKSVNQVFNMDITKGECWVQYRADGDSQKQKPKCLDPNCSYRTLELKEFGVNYSISLGKFYDYGLYTDMASVRNHLQDFFEKSKSVLNLYSYTGAFSLFALEKGARNVTSVDLSETYIEELENNIKLNSYEDNSHQSMTMSVNDALKELSNKKEKFDLIISDPPSSSSDKYKRTNALKEYENLLPKLKEILGDDGKMVIFLNTHRVNRSKFRQKIDQVIEQKELKLKVIKSLKLAQDCPELKGFPEGSYLKGLVLAHDRS